MGNASLAVGMYTVSAALILTNVSFLFQGNWQDVQEWSVEKNLIRWQGGPYRISRLIDDIKVEKIRGPDDEKFVKVGSFWQHQPVVIHLLRRFGCQFGRGHALELSKIVPTLEAKGVRVIAVGFEKHGLEDFVQGNYWNGSELYVDNGREIYSALQIKILSFMTMMKLSFSDDALLAYRKYKHIPHNFEGDQFQLGATFVLAKGGYLLLDFRQQNHAQHSSNKSILEALGLHHPVARFKHSDPSDRHNKTSSWRQTYQPYSHPPPAL